MPGDTKASSFLLGNRSGRPVDIYFKTRVPGQAEDSIKLLETMTLTIEKENMVIYEGPLHGKVLEEGLLLASLQGTGQEETIAFRVDMPKWLQNQSAMQKARVQWIFQQITSALPQITEEMEEKTRRWKRGRMLFRKRRLHMARFL